MKKLVARIPLYVLSIALLSLSACASSTETSPKIFDGHNDIILQFVGEDGLVDVSNAEIVAGLKGQSDLPRWRSGGFGGALLTVSASKSEPPYFDSVSESFDWFDSLVTNNSAALGKATTPAEARELIASGKLALLMALEGGDQFDGQVDNISRAYERGLRSALLVYDHNNDLGDGAKAFMGAAEASEPDAGGLTEKGRAFIEEMNKLGMIVDLSHAADETAKEAIAVSRAPILFSHSNARSLADTSRNLTDETMRAASAKGGLIMATFVPYLTTTEYWRWYDDGERTYAALAEAPDASRDSVRAGMSEWDEANPQPVVDMKDLADQIEYISNIVGRDHIGLGSDFDGMGDFVIPALSDAASAPALLDELRARGWSDREIAGIASENFLSFWERVVEASGQ